MNLYLIRHGESMGNLKGKIQGWMDYPLSELGSRQVQSIADFFKKAPLDHIYSSDLVRAYETAQAIGEAKGIHVQQWDQVREVYLGPFQGLTREEIYEKYPITKEKSILTSTIEGTETIDELTARCKLVINELQLTHKNEHVAIVSHGGFISIFLMYILTGEQWSIFHRPFQIGNTSITHIEWKENRKPLIHYMNQTMHLSALNSSSKAGLL